MKCNCREEQFKSFIFTAVYSDSMEKKARIRECLLCHYKVLMVPVANDGEAKNPPMWVKWIRGSHPSPFNAVEFIKRAEKPSETEQRSTSS